MRIIFLVIAAALVLSGCATNTNLTVMTYNIHHGQGIDGKLDLDRIAKVIENSGAELICLNEVDNNFGKRSEFEDQVKYLAESLEMDHVFGEALRYDTEGNPNLYGNAILTKHPIVNSTNYKLPTHKGRETRACLSVTVQVGKCNYTILATHLDHQENDVRIEQAKYIMNIMRDIKTPIILAGDFNCPPSNSENLKLSNPINIILEKLESSFELAGTGKASTVSSGKKIDYIFVSNDLRGKVKKAKVIRTELTEVASDHLPMIAELEL